MADDDIVSLRTSFSRDRRIIDATAQAKIEDQTADADMKRAKGAYLEANEANIKLAQTKKEITQARITKEDKRQEEERVNLSKAWKMEKVRFNAKMAKDAEEVNKELDEKIRILQEVHDVAMANLEDQLAHNEGPLQTLGGPKWSKTLLELIDTETKLVNLERFKEGRDVQVRQKELRKKEYALWEAERRKICETAVRRLKQKQDLEMKNLVQKCHGARVRHKRQQDLDFKCLQQKYRNLEHDQAHSHSLEFVAGAQGSPTGPNSTHQVLTPSPSLDTNSGHFQWSRGTWTVCR